MLEWLVVMLILHLSCGIWALPYSNRFKPSSKIFLLFVPRRYFFCGSFMFIRLVFVMPSCMSVYLYLVVTYWERVGLLALVCGVSL